MASIQMIIAMAIFGTIGLFVTGVTVPTAVISMVRALGGSALLGLVLLLRKKPLDKAKIQKNLLPLLLSGIGLGFNWILLFEAYRYTTVAVATLCYYMAPVIVILLSPLVLREKPGRGQLICSAAAVVGAVLISGAAGGGSFKGIALGLAAAGLYAAIVLTNRFIRGLEPLVTTFAQLAVAAVCMVGYNLLTGALRGLAPTGAEIGLLAVLAVVHTGLAYLLYFGSLQGLPAQRAAIMSYIDPVVAVLLSALVLHQPMSIPQIVGTVLILGAALISELLPKEQ